MKNYYTPNDFKTGSDSARIQAAIDAAARDGCGTVRIPRCNEAMGSMIWMIDKTILLPSDMTVILDNCHLCMAPGVMCQMFSNSLDLTDIGRTAEGEQRNIRILGEGNALLDGGEENALNEFSSGKNGLPSVRCNVTIGLHNVSGFVLDNFTVRDQRWWAIRCSYADHGRISNLHFELTRRHSDITRWRNQDGIDLRIGCHDVSIRNITGETGDDVIALTALSRVGSNDWADMVAGKSSDIHHVSIDHVHAFCSFCAIIRLLSQQGNKIRDVSITNIFDTSEYGKTAQVQKTLRIGEDGYYKTPEERGQAGDICNVFVCNVHSSAAAVIDLEMAVKNFHAQDIFVYGEGNHAATFGSFHCWREPITLYDGQDLDYVNHVVEQRADPRELPSYLENILIENVYCTSEPPQDCANRALFRFSRTEKKNVVIRRVTCDPARELFSFENGDTDEGLTFEAGE